MHANESLVLQLKPVYTAENFIFTLNSRLWCSGNTKASQALNEGSIPFSRFQNVCQYQRERPP